MTIFRGGGKIGRTQSSWPFVTLEVTERAIGIDIVVRAASIRRENVVQVVCKRRLLASAISIEHDDPASQKEIQFWTFSPDRVMAVVRALGYPVR